MKLVTMGTSDVQKATMPLIEASEIVMETVPLVRRDTNLGLTFCEKISYGLGNVFNDLTSAMWFSYLLLFLQVILQMEPVIAGALIFLGQLVDGLATPAVGILTDKFGTRKMWHFIGILMITLSFPLIFILCPWCSVSKIWQVIYFGLTISIFQIGWAMVQISHLSMIPDIPGPPSQRTVLTTIRYTISVMTNVTFYLITWSVLHIQSKRQKNVGPNDLYKFQEIAYIVVALGLFFTLLFYLGMRRYRQISYSRSSTHAESGAQSEMKPILKNFFLTKYIYQISLLYVASRLFLTLNLIYMPLFLDERQSIVPANFTGPAAGQAEDIASVPLLSYIASFVASILLKYAAEKYGNKMTYFFGSIISLVGCVWIESLHIKSDFINIYFIALLFGAGSAITLVTSLNITANFIGPHNNQGAMVYSIVTFADKVITGVAVVIIEQIKCDDPDLCPEYYRSILAYACGTAALIGLIVLASLFSSKV